MEEKLPKVLAVSLSTWRSDSGIHTQTDLFKFWQRDRLAQIYTRSDLPDTPVCDRFFQISENAVIKSIFNRKPVGRKVENGAKNSGKDLKAIQEEKKLYAVARKRHSWLMSLMREVVWFLGKWKSKALDDFIEEFNPDVYFIPIYPVAYMGWLQRYILKKYPKPYVCYLMDDNYTYIPCGKNPLAYLHRFILRKSVKKLAVNCNAMFAMTEMEAKETDKDFGSKSLVITKGIDYTNLTYEEKEIKAPVKMVYTGKLVIGRAVSLAAISLALKEINKDKTRITLDIYSPDVVDDKTMTLLNSNGCSHKGSVSKDKVEEIQNNADIVVFAESLEKKYRNAARLSFSTKLTDYFKSGKCIFAIGDRNIAPIDYLITNDAAVVVTEYEQIKEKLEELLINNDKIHEYGKKAFECGKRNHSEEKIKEAFISAFTDVCEECAVEERN